MKALNKWMNIIRPSEPVLRAVGDMIRLNPEVPSLDDMADNPTLRSGHVAYVLPRVEHWERYKPPGMPLNHWMSTVSYWFAEPSRVASVWALADFFKIGPKVYFPTKDQYTALAFADPSFPLEQYQQPFSTFTLRIPDGAYPQMAQPPRLAIGRYHQMPDKKMVGFALTCVCGEPTGQASMLTSYFGCEYDRYPTMGAVVKKSREGYAVSRNVVDEWSLHMTTSEQDVLEQVQNAFVNICMLLTPGCQKVGSSNPAYEADLQAKLKKKKLPDSVRTSVENDLRLMPMVYSLNQDIKIFNVEDNNKEQPEAGSSGVMMSPHWRRGHWRQQAHGPQLSLRRAQYIAAVLVNGSRFGGLGLDAVSSYRT